MSYENVTSVKFPEFTGLNVNMMPIIHGDLSTVPKELQAYEPLMAACKKLVVGKLAYLTVQESFVEAGQTQRRPGAHTEANNQAGWGGGWGRSATGLYMASSDGACTIWNTRVDRETVDQYGGVKTGLSDEDAAACEANRLYWLTDRTPHEAMPTKASGPRQFFRLVSHEVGAWWRQHSTPNPLGIVPDCTIIETSKFA